MIVAGQVFLQTYAMNVKAMVVCMKVLVSNSADLKLDMISDRKSMQ